MEAECALVAGAPFAETFMTAASPGIVASIMQNRHYGSMPEYLTRSQPQWQSSTRPSSDTACCSRSTRRTSLLERHQLFGDRPLADFIDWAEYAVDALNAALTGIDPANVRMHLCWGNYEGPHTHDVNLDDILPVVYRANVGAIVVSMANARHAHEFACFARRPLPKGMVLVAGVIDTTTNYVEHPEVVANRLVRISEAVGDPTRIIAGTDCGFDTTAGIGDIAPSVVWEKLRALRAGADLASARLY